MPNQNSTQMTRRAFLAVGLMLFALFFGAGNLIFPAALGQRAGTNVWWAVMGFVLTGVGLPLAGVLAMGYSGCRNVQELAGRVHPLFGILFTLALYLSIGPAFAIPRTGTVSFEIAVRPFLSPDADYWAQIVFLIVFFLVTLWLSINPQKLVGRIGGILTPMLLTTIVVLIVKSLITPPGTPGSPTEAYATPAVALQQGFIDGYNTLDALASFVFGILVIEFVTQHGATTRHEVMGATMRAGMIAIGCLGVVYVFIAGLGAASVEQLGILDTGAPVLAGSARLLFGEPGALILAVIVLLACLTTSIGLVTACVRHQLLRRRHLRTEDHHLCRRARAHVPLSAGHCAHRARLFGQPLRQSAQRLRLDRWPDAHLGAHLRTRGGQHLARCFRSFLRRPCAAAR